MTSDCGTNVGGHASAINWRRLARVTTPCRCIAMRCRALGTWPRMENIGSTLVARVRQPNGWLSVAVSSSRNERRCRPGFWPSGGRSSRCWAWLTPDALLRGLSLSFERRMGLGRSDHIHGTSSPAKTATPHPHLAAAPTPRAATAHANAPRPRPWQRWFGANPGSA